MHGTTTAIPTVAVGRVALPAPGAGARICL